MEMTKAVPSGASPVNALFSMFYEPTRAFGMLEPRRYTWLPLILLLLSATGLLMWYFSMVNFDWLQHEMLSAIKDASEREQSKGFMTKGTFQASAIGGTLVMYPLMFALTGLYLMIAGKVINKDVSFGSGFALAVWSAVPALLLFPLGAIQILMSSGGEFGFSELNPLSLNQLVFHFGMGHPMASLADTVSVPSIWSMFLMVIGFQVWAKTAMSTAIKVVALPYLTIYGIWLAIALSKAA